MATQRDARRGDAFAVVATVLLGLGWFAMRMSFDRVPFSGDILGYHYFMDAYAADVVRTGTLPIWNPWQLCGLPFIATLEAGVFYPLNWFHLVLPTHQALAATTLCHTLLMGLGTWLFVRRAGLGAAAGFIAATLFTTRGTVPLLGASPNLVAAGAWLPIGMYAVLDLVERPRARAIARLAAIAGMSLLGGHPQITIYLCYAWGSLWVAWCIVRRLGPGDWLRTGGYFGSALLLGALLAAIQLLPTAELSALGDRALRPLSEAHVAPMGALTPAVRQLRQVPIIGDPLAFGAVGLACAALALAGRRARALALWAFVLFVVSGTLAMGPLTPVFPLYMALPALAWFRLPERLMWLTDFAFAVLAGVGADRVIQGRDPNSRTGPMTLGLAGLPVAVVGYLALARPVGGVSRLALAALLAGAAAVRSTGWGSRVAGVVVAASVVVDVAMLPEPQLRLPFTAARVERLSAYDRSYEAVRGFAGHDRVWLASRPFDPAFSPKQGIHQRLRNFDDYEPMYLRRQAEYVTFLVEARATPANPTVMFNGRLPSLDPRPGVEPPVGRRRLLDLAGVRYVVADSLKFAPGVTTLLREGGYRSVAIPGPLLAWENPRALPRAYTVYRTRPAPSAEALLAELAAPDFDPLAVSFVEGDPGFASAPEAPPRGAPARFEVDDPSVVELAVDLAAPGLVVLSDTFYPGWRATVDGAPVSIVATNHLFRGVPVPAGNHRVRFTYVPMRLYAGAALSGVTVLVLLALALTAFDARGRGAYGPRDV